MWRLTDYPVEKIAVNTIVAGVYNRREMDESSLHIATRMGSSALNRLRETKLSLGEEMLMTPPKGWKTPWVLWIGLGDPMEFSAETLAMVLHKCTKTLKNIGAEEACFTLLGEGASHNPNLAELGETLLSYTSFKKGEIFHPRREVLYRLFAALPDRFYYNLWPQQENGPKQGKAR